MLATHYAGKAEPVANKKQRVDSAHLTAPLMGLSLATQYTSPEDNSVVTDARTATILKNFVIEDDRIKTRAGYKKTATRGTAPVWHLIPFYGEPAALAAASNGELWNAQNGDLIKGGFSSNDWHWTSFANLGQQKFTVMVNGADGVWSWNGTLAPGTDPPAIMVTSLSNSNPAVITVAAFDTPKLQNGMTVVITGATGTGMTVANGSHVIQGVAAPANSYALVGVDTSSGAAPQTTGVQVDAPAAQPMFKETVTADPADTFISPNAFQIVVAHQNRLFFADGSNLAVYYLPLQQKSGQVKYLPLNAVFKRGGHIRAMYTWTTEGGENLNDQLVIFTSNGECAIYGGFDPDTNFALSGVFRFDAPMSKHSVMNYGGDLFVLISTGLIPLSVLIKAEGDQASQYDRNVISFFLADAIRYRNDAGWMTFLNPSTGRLFCNVPQGAPNRYKQMIRHMPRPVWSEFADVPARCWGWIDPFVYFGDDDGNVYEMYPAHQSDDGKQIMVDVQMAWSRFKTMAEKHFLAVRSYMITDGAPRPMIDVKVNYDYGLPVNTPEDTEVASGATWDEATWDEDYWAPGEHAAARWHGVAPSGIVGAVRLRALVYNCAFSITGFDVSFEEGNFAP